MVAHRLRPLGGHCYDSLFPTGEWRNWQTRRIQVPVSFTGRGGSTPPSPTNRCPATIRVLLAVIGGSLGCRCHGHLRCLRVRRTGGSTLLPDLCSPARRHI